MELRRKQKRKKTRDILCIMLLALVITLLIGFGLSQNVTEEEQNMTILMSENITIPENGTSRENVIELTETQPVNISDMPAPEITILAPLNTTYNIYSGANSSWDPGLCDIIFLYYPRPAAHPRISGYHAAPQEKKKEAFEITK